MRYCSCLPREVWLGGRGLGSLATPIGKAAAFPSIYTYPARLLPCILLSASLLVDLPRFSSLLHEVNVTSLIP